MKLNRIYAPKAPRAAADEAQLRRWHAHNGAFFEMSLDTARREAARLGGVDCLPVREQYEAHDARIAELQYYTEEDQ